MSVQALKALTTIAVTTVVLTLAGSAPAQTVQTQPIRKVSVAQVTIEDKKLSAQQRAQLKKAALQVGTLRRLAWSCQDDLIKSGILEHRTKAETSIWALPLSVKYRTKYVAKHWATIAEGCQQTFREHRIPNIQDWLVAIKWVQKIYPGTYDFLYSISDREGGFGRWVWYGGGLWTGHHIGDDFLGADTVGGWMQFRYSTFAPYWRAAQENLRSRGYILPEMHMPPPGGDPRYIGWLNPMGQALTAAYMKWSHREGCHWCLG